MASQISLSPSTKSSSATCHLIFFITGNPGLVSYYDAFLRTLHELLSGSETSKSNAFHIFGQNLAGFGDNDIPLKTAGHPYSLEDQIEDRIRSLKLQRIPSGPRKGQHFDSIILIGHSLGTYIILEILRRLREASSLLNVKAGILLMPTVVHLAESPSGVKFSPLFRIPGFPRGVSILAKALLWPFPGAALRWVARTVMDMPEDAANVTTGFLKSRMGIWQALHLARDELEQMTEDKWDEDIWGIEHEDLESKNKSNIPKLIFYFAEEDHWIANHTREQLIAARARDEGEDLSSKPLMMIDTNGIGHAFCIRHSETIAEKVKVWIEDIIEASRQ